MLSLANSNIDSTESVGHKSTENPSYSSKKSTVMISDQSFSCSL